MRLSGYQKKANLTKKAVVDFSDPLKSLLDDRIPEKCWGKAIRIRKDQATYTKNILSSEKSPLRVYFWVQIAARGL